MLTKDPNQKVRQVAAYFLALNASSEDNDLTQLKLQKLLYYAQGICLAISGKPLFNDKIHAWPHGPVCTVIYHDFPNGSGLLTPYENNDVLVSALSNEDQHLIYFVNMVYGRYGALTLRHMTHQESPWQWVINSQQEITQDSIKDYFEKMLADEEDYALRHSSDNDELEDIADHLACLKYDYDIDKTTISHEEFWRDIA